jgi:hypothetical protein
VKQEPHLCNWVNDLERLWTFASEPRYWQFLPRRKSVLRAVSAHTAPTGRHEGHTGSATKATTALPGGKLEGTNGPKPKKKGQAQALREAATGTYAYESAPVVSKTRKGKKR